MIYQLFVFRCQRLVPCNRLAGIRQVGISWESPYRRSLAPGRESLPTKMRRHL